MPRKGSRDTKPQVDLGFPAGHEAGEPTAAGEHPAPELVRHLLKLVAQEMSAQGAAAEPAGAKVKYEAGERIKLVARHRDGSKTEYLLPRDVEVNVKKLFRQSFVNFLLFGAAQVPVADGPVPGGAQVRRD